MNTLGNGTRFFGVMLLLGLGSAGCFAEVGGTEDDTAVEQSAVTAADAGAKAKATVQTAAQSTDQTLRPPPSKPTASQPAGGGSPRPQKTATATQPVGSTPKKPSSAEAAGGQR